MPSSPLVITLVLDAVSQRHLDVLRREHFPPERNHLAAHVTLFHALPSGLETEAAVALEATARRPAFEVAVTGVRLLGRGVAYDLRSPDLGDVRSGLARQWHDRLTRQDAQPFRPHVTVQNKVAPDVAHTLHARLAAEFVPWTAHGVGLALWRYAGGPWDPITAHWFSGTSGTASPGSVSAPVRD